MRSASRWFVLIFASAGMMLLNVMLCSAVRRRDEQPRAEQKARLPSTTQRGVTQRASIGYFLWCCDKACQS